MRWTLAVLIFLLGGCAEPMLRGYIDRPLVEAVDDLGTPQRAMDVASGARVFVWRTEDLSLVSGLKNSNFYGKGPTDPDYSTVAAVNKDAFACEYWLYAKPNVERPVAADHWTVVAVRPQAAYYYMCR